LAGPEPLPGAPFGVQVHLDAPPGTGLLQSTEKGQWTTACVAPCDATLPTGAIYRFAGAGYKTSTVFVLNGAGGQLEAIEVRPASKTAYGIGIGALAVGCAAIFIVQFAWPVYALAQAFEEPPTGIPIWLPLTTLAGLSLTISGIVLMVSHARTKVSQRVYATTAPALTSKPLWYVPTTSPIEPGARALPMAPAAPIFSLSF
jgi:hypothetical protein